MINYWWVTRPKRKLNSVPEVLATIAEDTLDKEWTGNRAEHLSVEDTLEKAGLKRIGNRRDHTGGGGRTYMAWLESLGLLFKESNGRVRLTLAGEALLQDNSPVEILTNQVLKYQFPSSFSLKRNVDVNRRFKIHPFRFLLKLLYDERIQFLTQEEIAKIVIVEAENESEASYEYIVGRILAFRNDGDSILPSDFFSRYKPSNKGVDLENPFGPLLDVANTLINWLEYTQFIYRDHSQIAILDAKKEEAKQFLLSPSKFIERPEDEEYFQRKYGLDPKHTKDTRNLSNTVTVTANMIARQQIITAYIKESARRPITKISNSLVETISEETGCNESFVEDVLTSQYPNGSIGAFMTEYFEMAFKGRDEATDFEKATVELFNSSFGFTSKHIGPIGLTPDVLIISDDEGYQAIIDNKAYHKYSITNDHHNRMVHNYIEGLQNYSVNPAPLAFFSYIAGGFGRGINGQIKSICEATGVNGSAINVTNMIHLVEENEKNPFSQAKIRDIFSVDRQILLSDFCG